MPNYWQQLVNDIKMTMIPKNQKAAINHWFTAA